ncbi:chemotaxis protein chea [Plakobranchus ocellatus]|uniref:Chemotaxis protein chea n=1 Tax=Plakobranchus ocellatus TaxID=259542 RepID=A0AAV4DZD5_9GAST|nr:chemotaxis protein chea [Plakobranchus ocellatus]
MADRADFMSVFIRFMVTLAVSFRSEADDMTVNKSAVPFILYRPVLSISTPSKPNLQANSISEVCSKPAPLGLEIKSWPRVALITRSPWKGVNDTHRPSAILDNVPYTASAIQDNAPYTASAIQDNAPYTASAFQDNTPYTASAIVDNVPYTASAILDNAPYTASTILDNAPYTASAILDNLLYTASAIQDNAPYIASALQDNVPYTRQRFLHCLFNTEYCTTFYKPTTRQRFLYL